MALPSQVEAAGKRADEIAAQMLSGVETPGTDQDGQASDVQPGGQSPPEEPEGRERQAQPSETLEETKGKNKELQHKFDVLKGKYNAEVKSVKDDVERMREYNRQLLATQAALNDTIKELREHLDKQKGGSPEPKTPAAVIGEDFDVSKVLSQDDMNHLEAEDLGGKTLQILTKLARAASGNGVSRQFEERLSQVSTKVDQFGQKIAENEQKTLNERLVEAIPDFWTVNEDPVWFKWLDDTMRRQTLQSAFVNQDIDTVRRGVEAFKAETGWGSKKERQQQPAQPQKPRLERHVEPSQDFVGTPAENGGGRVYTRGEVAKFYTDRTKGRWNGREDEFNKIDRDITLAQRDGRIREG